MLGYRLKIMSIERYGALLLGRQTLLLIRLSREVTLVIGSAVVSDGCARSGLGHHIALGHHVDHDHHTDHCGGHHVGRRGDHHNGLGHAFDRRTDLWSALDTRLS